MTRIITIANQKGGIGKTTTSTSVAGILRHRGYKTLLIDADSQCNSTDVFQAKTDGVATLYDVILEEKEKRVPLDEAIQHTEAGDILASDQLLNNAEAILNSDINGYFRLQDAIAESKAGYDFMIIDTNPVLNRMLVNCLIASNELIVPISADRFGMTALNQLNETVISVKKRYNRELKVNGLLLVQYRANTNLQKDISTELEEIAGKLGTKVYHTRIRDSIKVKESQTVRKLLIDYAPKCTSELDYEAFVDELLADGA